MLGENPAASHCLSGVAMSPSPSPRDYAGDISAAEAWELLKADPKAQLLDVRTMAEWNFVGLPDLVSLGRGVHCVEWQQFPAGSINPDFVDEASGALACGNGGSQRYASVLFL